MVLWYKEYIKALRRYAKEHEKDIVPTGQIYISKLCSDTANILENEVVERDKIDKAIEELRKEIEENHLNVIDYADGEWIVKDFVYGAIDRLKEKIALDK